MGRKKNPNKTALSLTENTTEKEDDFQLNLDVLDGNNVPSDSDSDEIVETQPRKRRKRKSKKRQVLGVDHQQMEEKRLEHVLFGGLVEQFADQTPVVVEITTEDTNENVDINTKENDHDILPADLLGNNLGSSQTTGRKPAWVDDDDEVTKLKDVVASYSRGKGKHGDKETSETNYKKYLEKNFKSVHGLTTPKWAELSGSKKRAKKDSDDDSEDEQMLARTARDFMVKDSTVLPKDFVKIKRMKDINKDTRAEGAQIKSIEFHKKQSVAMVAGTSGVVTLFQVDGKRNAKIQSIRFNQFPIHKAQFSASGEEFFASSFQTGQIQVHNITSGKSFIIPHNKSMEQGSYKNFIVSPNGSIIAFQGRFGYIYLMSARSKEWMGSLKMNGEVHSLTFNPDGSRLYSHGELGEVYVWDMNTRRCVHKFVDDGCITGTALAMAPTQQYLACGSSSGVVNLYDTSKLEKTLAPKPEKALMNLVTKTTGIVFHPSSEMVGIYSGSKENAVKLVHFPSMTVFKNFPTAKEAASLVQTMDFSPNGGYMALGLSNGTAELYRLHHYDQY